ncbi:MAG: DUF695 domain-containing protein [Phycisphaeraceae bacterium]|nr:DUF695 domain-containing protein [Phycisphaeraceae bacterium]
MNQREPNARVYQRVIDGKPAIVAVDEDFIDERLRRGMSACVVASAQFSERDEHGLPGPGAVEQLRLLDEHVGAAAEQCDGVLAATVTTDGIRSWYLYGAKQEPLLRSVAAGARAGGPMRAGIALGAQVGIVVRGEVDPTWKRFSDALPTPEEKRWNDDLAVIEQLEEFGDDHSVPRPIEHLAILPSEAARREFVLWLGENGFEPTAQPAKPEPRGWPIEFAIESEIDIDAIYEQTCDITVEAERLGGIYDGWQTRAVEKNDLGSGGAT